MNDSHSYGWIWYPGCVLAGMLFSFLYVYLLGFTMAFASPSGWFDTLGAVAGLLLWHTLVVHGLALVLPLLPVLYIIRRYGPRPSWLPALVFIVVLMLAVFFVQPLLYGPPYFVPYVDYQRPWYAYTFELALLIAWLLTKLALHSAPGHRPQG